MEVLKMKDKKQMNANDLFELKQALEKSLNTSSSLKGRYVRFFLDNLKVIDPVLMPIVQEHGKVVEECCKKDENGQVIRTQQGFEFENDDLKQKYEAESKRVWEDGEVDVKLVKISLDVFDEIPFNMAENDKVYLIYDNLVRFL